MQTMPETMQLTAKQQQLERLISTINLPEQQRIYCQKGCANCCSLVVNCSFPEAVTIAHQLTCEQQTRTIAMVPRIVEVAKESATLIDFLRSYRTIIGGCVFLDADDQSCSVYTTRPLSCRALLSTRPSGWCDVDFATLHPLEKEAFLSSLDRDIVNYPTHYLAAPQELASDLESDLALTMQEECGFGLSGNLVYQVWLELEHQLSKRLQDTQFDLSDYLNQHDLFEPLLLQVKGKR